MLGTTERRTTISLVPPDLPAGSTVVRLDAPSRAVAELLDSTGLERCLAVCPDLPSALTWGGEPARAAATPQLLAG